METKFNFNSQVCTNRQQSERLLALGLKTKTADICFDIESNVCSSELPRAFTLKNRHRIIPAWSLHRLLLLLLDNRCVAYDHISFSIDETDVFTKIINHIEWLIKEGYFNKEYLV